MKSRHQWNEPGDRKRSKVLNKRFTNRIARRKYRGKFK